MTWTAISASRQAADAVIDETLVQDTIANIEHVTSDGVDINTDLVSQDSIAASAVGQGELKGATETQSTTTTGLVTFSNGIYGFGCGHYASDANAYTWQWGSNASPGGSLTHSVLVTYTAAANTKYFRIQYIQASPPYPFAGRSDWGLWALRLVSRDGSIVRQYLAADPPWAHLWKHRYRKGDPRAMSEHPHPFGELEPGQRVELVDLGHLEELSEERWTPAAHRLARRYAADPEAMAEAELEQVAISWSEREYVDFPERCKGIMDRLARKCRRMSNDAAQAVNDRAATRLAWRAEYLRRKAGILTKSEMIFAKAAAGGMLELPAIEVLAEYRNAKERKAELPEALRSAGFVLLG